MLWDWENSHNKRSAYLCQDYFLCCLKPRSCLCVLLPTSLHCLRETSATSEPVAASRGLGWRGPRFQPRGLFVGHKAARDAPNEFQSSALVQSIASCHAFLDVSRSALLLSFLALCLSLSVFSFFVSLFLVSLTASRYASTTLASFVLFVHLYFCTKYLYRLSFASFWLEQRLVFGTISSSSP